MKRSTHATRLTLVSIIASCFAPVGALAVCPCDWDSNAVLDCADFNAYMNDWFANNPVADFNQVGGNSVQDIFDYLECLNQTLNWTSGPGSGITCPAAPTPPISAIGVFSPNEYDYAATIDDGQTVSFNTSPCASTDGPPEPACFSGTDLNDLQILNDYWYIYSAQSTGTITVDTCFPFTQTTINTRLAVYEGAAKPAFQSGRLISCSDSGFNNCFFGRAKLTVNVTGGRDYLIRVGDDGSARGPARLILTFSSSAAVCPAGIGTSTSNFSISGNGNGGLWSWSVQTPSGSVSGLENAGVIGTAAQVATRFVNDINAASSSASCGAALSAADLGSGNFSITTAGPAAPTLWVGANPGTPTCRVGSPLGIGAAPCQFNPSIVQVSGLDCNGNARDDTLDILADSSSDYDHDGIPDECGCPGDFNHDDAVSPQDLFDFLAAFFAHTPAGDFNRSGTYTPDDIFDFLAAFFTHCL